MCDITKNRVLMIQPGPSTCMCESGYDDNGIDELCVPQTPPPDCNGF